MSPEEIQARAGLEAPFLRLPRTESVFAERAMRLRQLARGHAMGDFLGFVADLAQQQQALLARFPAVPLPDAQAFERAGQRGLPPLQAFDWPRDGAWRDGLRQMVASLSPDATEGVKAVLASLAQADDATLEHQADALLTGRVQDLDLGQAPVVAAALQVYFTHLVVAAAADLPERERSYGRLDDPGLCPCCGSRPTASLVPAVADTPGQRYLHCSLCSSQWHYPRIRCTHCGRDERVAYESLDVADRPEDVNPENARPAPVQAEVCDGCNHYLKIVHADRDPFVEPVADDLASLTLDLLVSDAGHVRHGVNLLLLFGEPEPPPDPGAS